MEINDTVVYNMVLNDVYTVLSQCAPGPVHIIISRHPDPKVCSASPSFTLPQLTESSLCWLSCNVDGCLCTVRVVQGNDQDFRATTNQHSDKKYFSFEFSVTSLNMISGATAAGRAAVVSGSNLDSS